jgi:hypothetical protein
MAAAPRRPPEFIPGWLPLKPFPSMPGLNRSLAMLAFPSAALLLSAGALQAQVERGQSDGLLATVTEVADTVRPGTTVDSITLDSVRPMRRPGGPCGQPAPMPEAKPSSDPVEMPRAAPSPKTLPIPTIHCDTSRTVLDDLPALRLGPGGGAAPADRVSPPEPR